MPVAPIAGHDRPRGVRSLLAAAVLAATLSSVATYSLLSAVAGFPPLDVEPAARQPMATDQAVAGRPAVSGDQVDDLPAIVARARESVVTITTQGIASDRLSPFDIPTSGVGSGIVVSSSGLILTNNHVIAGARTVTVATSDGQELSATVVATQPERDLAVIRASGGVLVAAEVGDSAMLEVGQTVLAIGSPLGEYTETVTRGIVSALDRTITVADERGGRPTRLSGLIQTDAAINPGNSGGPLIDEHGRVMGINSAVSRSAEGIGFAIPIATALALIDQAATSAS